MSPSRSTLAVGCYLLIILLLFRAAPLTEAQDQLTWAGATELGGSFSVYSYGQSPFNRPAPFLTLEERQAFSNGSNAFTRVNEPIGNHNSHSCGNCHFRDGRGLAHAALLSSTGFSVPSNPIKPVFRHPDLKGPDVALLNSVVWRTERTVVFPDRSSVKLLAPVAIVDGKKQEVDLRNAPAIYGLGLIEAIADSEILEFSLTRPYAKFGIVGAPARVDGKIGRFGWKGKFSSLETQVRNAIVFELGIHDQTTQRATSSTIDQLKTDLTEYLRLLAVPARRLSSANEYGRGAAIFAKIGCVMCHRPSWRTSNATDVPEEYRNQVIYPFSDFLLHDMGDGLRDPNNNDLSRLWKTPTLWGLGLQPSVSEAAGFLHDGRARSILEAILWHGGEAKESTRKFERLQTKDREALLEFLSSL